jgi:hypothetical protein
MKSIAWAAILLSIIASAAAGAVSNTKITVQFQAVPIAGAASQIARLSHAWILVDPKAQCSITASLNDAGLSQALDAITKPGNLSWKKLTLARQANDEVSIEELKSGILALASMPLVGLSVENSDSKTSDIFARGVSVKSNTSQIKLPENYTWTTIYVILGSTAISATTPTARKDEIRSLSEIHSEWLMHVSSLSPTERQQVMQNEWIAKLRLPTEVRRSMFTDQTIALLGLDPQFRNQISQDYTYATRGLNDPLHPNKPVKKRKSTARQSR